MSRGLAIVLIIVAFGVGVAAGALGILYGTGDLAAPSQNAANVAPTLSLDQPTATPGELVAIATEIGAANTKIDALASEVAQLRQESVAVAQAMQATPVPMVETDAPEPPEPVETEEMVVEAEPASDLPERVLFRIDPEQSEVRFKIDETLAGNQIVVTGVTDDVAGDVIVNFQNPGMSQVGEIVINARTLKTDNDFRNQSIHSRILDTRDFEFIRFAPTGLQAIADTVAVGETVEFQIEGDLTIRDVTQTVTFDITVTADAIDQITGFAQTIIDYEDFGLEINPPPAVGGVGDVVTLEIDFVAGAVDER